MASLKKSCARPPTPQAGWVHQIHAAWGLAAPPPWWWYLLGLLCGVCFGLVWLSSLVVCRQVWENILKVRLWVWQSGPPRLAPYRHLWSQNDVNTSWLRGWQPPQTISPIHIRHIQSGWAHWNAVHWHTATALHSFTHTTWIRFWGSEAHLKY